MLEQTNKKSSIGVGLCLVQVLLIEIYLLGLAKYDWNHCSDLEHQDCNPHHVHGNIFSSIIFIQYRVCCKPWSPINILQRRKIVNFPFLDCGKHNYWDKVLQNRTRSSSWNCLLFSNSLHQIPLHGVGWRYVSRQSTESISASPRTFSWYWNSKKSFINKGGIFQWPCNFSHSIVSRNIYSLLYNYTSSYQ